MATKRKHPSFDALLEHAAGRADRTVTSHVAGCADCATRLASAERMVAAGRRALTAPRPSRRAFRRALAHFRDARAPRTPSLLELVFDSFRQAAAVRDAQRAARFLRYEGACTVELQLERGTDGIDLRGQLEPARFAPEIVVVAGKRRLRARVEADGTFHVRGIRPGPLTLEIGAVRIADLEA